MKFFRTLPSWDYAPSSDSGARFDLGPIPTELNKAAVYVRALLINVAGTVTSTAGGAANLPKLLSQVLVELPDGIGELVNVSGSRLARLYRLENGGNVPPAAAPASAWTGATLAAGANAVDMTYIVEFANKNQRKVDDGSIPLALLKKAVAFKVATPARGAIIADHTAESLKVTVTLELVSQREKRVPALCRIAQNLDHGGASIEPALPILDGKVESYGIVPSGDAGFGATTDLALLGFQWGEFVKQENGKSSGSFYDAFNRTAATALTKHTAAVTDKCSVLPVEFPQNGRAQGHHMSYEAPHAKVAPHYTADVCATAVGSVYRIRRSRADGWYPIACRYLGLDPAKGRAVTGSHKPNAAAHVTNYLPAKFD